MLTTTEHLTNGPRPLSLSELRRVKSDHLFERGRLLVIEHAGSDYLLRITRQGKLILTK